MTFDPTTLPELDRPSTPSHDLALDGGAGGAAAPGKRTRTQGMSPSIDRIADRVAMVLQRRAEPGGAARDDNGVAANAEAAVDRAAGSTGAPLRNDVRSRFEQSLGADLSAVRVHTGEASAQASAAVGARAYTTGNDIHFKQGAYQPDDPFGLHLLAHEVAHTQQQAGGAAQRQHKLEVSSPHDGAEAEADHAADAMVRGEAAAVSFGSGVQRLIQRDPDPAAAAAPATQAGAFQLPGPRMPSRFNLLSGSSEGLETEVLSTNAFKGVPPEDPLFATITQFCSPDTWSNPSQTKSINVSTQQAGMKGGWSIKVTPTLVPSPLHLGGAGRMKISTASTTAVASGGTTTSGSEVSGEVEVGPAKGNAKSNQGTGTSHGGGYSGGGGAEGEYEAQRFNCTVHFGIEINGGWSEGGTSIAARAAAAFLTFGLSETARTAHNAMTPEQRSWSVGFETRYVITVPTEICTKTVI